MRSIVFMVAAAAIMMFAPSAHAREHHYYHHSHHGHVARHGSFAKSQFGRTIEGSSDWTSNAFAYSNQPTYRGRERGRPPAWCGWEMRRLVGSDPGPSYNLAHNWTHWGRPGPVGIGAVVVWAHHVGKIVGQENGQWLIESGNDGHALRTRARSIAGAIAIRWG
jgi:hypothetical protein